MKVLPRMTLLEHASPGPAWHLSLESGTIAVPLLRKQADVQPRNYVLVEEVHDALNASDTGRIDRIRVLGLGKPIFVRGGLIFEGIGTQNRAVESGMVVLPETPVEVPVKCVHASHPISARATMRLSETGAPSMVAFFLTRAALGHADQRHVWEAVARYSASSLGAGRNRPASGNSGVDEPRHPPLGSDSLVRVQQAVGEFNMKLNNVLEKLPVDYPDQVGMAVIDINGFLGLELFDHPDSWRAASKAVARKYAEVFSEEVETAQKRFKLDEEALGAVLNEIIGIYSKRTEKVAAQNERSKTYVFEAPSFVGERTELDRYEIHLMMARNLHPDLG